MGLSEVEIYCSRDKGLKRGLAVGDLISYKFWHHRFLSFPLVQNLCPIFEITVKRSQVEQCNWAYN
jgi:hypothetical protein